MSQLACQYRYMKPVKKRFAWIRGICDRCGEVKFIRHWTSVEMNLCSDCIQTATAEIAAWDKETPTEGKAV